MPYILRSYQGINSDVNVNDNTVESTQTSIKFVGYGLSPYGEPIQESIYNILENFAGNNPPLNPVYGQLWYDTLSQKLRIYTTSNVWQPIGGVSYGTSFPTSPQSGDLFFYDDGGFNKILYAYDGSNWIRINGIFSGGTPPSTALANGHMWYDTSNQMLGVFFNGQWYMLQTLGNYGGNNFAGNSILNFIHLTGTNKTVGIIELSGKIVAAWSEDNATIAELNSTVYRFRNGATTTLDIHFPNGISRGLNFNRNFSTIRFTGNIPGGRAKITSDSTVTWLDFDIGNINKMSVQTNKIVTNVPIEATNNNYWRIPFGATGSRPSTPVEGMLRYNTTTKDLEFWDGTQWKTYVDFNDMTTYVANELTNFLSTSVSAYVSSVFAQKAFVCANMNHAGGGLFVVNTGKPEPLILGVYLRVVNSIGGSVVPPRIFSLYARGFDEAAGPNQDKLLIYVSSDQIKVDIIDPLDFPNPPGRVDVSNITGGGARLFCIYYSRT